METLTKQFIQKQIGAEAYNPTPWKLSAGVGRMLIRFTKKQIDQSAQIRHGSLSLLVANPANPNDYSIEAAEVFAINEAQSFFKVGDLVLVNYAVFSQGRYKDRVKTASRRLETLADGSEIYYAYDGTDGYNDSDIYARVKAGQIEMCPGYVLLQTLREAKPKSIIYQPQAPVSKIKKAIIQSIHRRDAEEMDLSVDDHVLLEAEFLMEVRTDKVNLEIIKTKYLVGRYGKRPQESI